MNNNLIKKVQKMINNIYIKSFNTNGPIPAHARRRKSINKNEENRKNLVKKTIPSSPLKRKYSANKNLNNPNILKLKFKKFK